MPARTSPIRLLAAASLLAVLASCRVVPGPVEVVGRVVVARTRTAVTVPADAVLEVQVADVTRADQAPLVVVRRTFTPLGQPPWPFTFRGDSLGGLDSTHVYALQARVTVAGRPLLVSKKRHRLDPARLADTLEVIVEPTGRTVGVRPGGEPERLALRWNPPGRPATLPARFSAPSSRPAAVPPAERARDPFPPPEAFACPPTPAR